jgi:hypothetical protein
MRDRSLAAAEGSGHIPLAQFPYLLSFYDYRGDSFLDFPHDDDNYMLSVENYQEI